MNKAADMDRPGAAAFYALVPERNIAACRRTGGRGLSRGKGLPAR